MNPPNPTHQKKNSAATRKPVQFSIPKPTFTTQKPNIDLAPIRLVCATRENPQDFLAKTALGQSLSKYPWPMDIVLFAQNNVGLPQIYNQALADAKNRPAILVFIHDDACLCDYFWANEIRAGLKAFDMIGLAGNRRRVKDQPAWSFTDSKLIWDDTENLSGTVAYGKGFRTDGITIYGTPRQEVKLLDGVLLAMHSETFHHNDIRFDESFNFHFYDLDICRQVEAKHLKMGTWPIALIHESHGAFGGEPWQQAYAQYLAKWGS